MYYVIKIYFLGHILFTQCSLLYVCIAICDVRLVTNKHRLRATGQRLNCVQVYAFDCKVAVATSRLSEMKTIYCGIFNGMCVRCWIRLWLPLRLFLIYLTAIDSHLKNYSSSSWNRNGRQLHPATDNVIVTKFNFTNSNNKKAFASYFIDCQLHKEKRKSMFDNTHGSRSRSQTLQCITGSQSIAKHKSDDCQCTKKVKKIKSPELWVCQVW